MTTQLTSDITQQYQREIAPRGSTLYYSVLYTEPAQKQAIIFVDGLHKTLKKIIINCNELSVAKMKLEWWRQQIEKLYHGKAEHPIAQVLQHYVDPFSLPAELLLSMIDATEYYLDHAPLKDLQQRQNYLFSTAGAREQLISRIVNQRTPVDIINQVAAGIEMTQQLTQCYATLQRGYHFFSLEELAQYHVEIAELEQGQPSDNVKQFIQQQIQQAQTTLDSDQPLPTVTAIRQHLASMVLKKLADNPLQVFSKQTELNPIYQLYVAWRFSLNNR